MNNDTTHASRVTRYASRLTDIILIILLLFPPLIYGGVQQYAVFLINLTTIFIVFLLIIKGFIEKKYSFHRTPLDIPFLIFLGVTIFYTVNTIYFYGSFMELCKTLNYIAVYYIAVNHIRSRKKIKFFTWTMIVIAACMTIYGFKQYLEGTSNMVTPSYVCHNHYAGFIELCLPLSIALIFTEEKTVSIGAAIISVINGFGLMYSMSRGGWMSFLAAFILMVILFIWKKDNLYSGERERKVFITNIITWVLILIVLSVPLLVKERAKTIFQQDKNQIGSEALSFRIPVWTNSLKMIQDQNYLGRGPGSFIYLYAPYNKEMPDIFMNAAHSDYLQMAVETGLPGVLSFLFILLMFYITVIKYLKYKGSDLSAFTRELVKKDQILAIGYTTAITSISLHGIGDFNFQIPANVIYFFMIMGLTMSLKSLTDKKDIIEKEHTSYTKTTIAVTALSSIILLTALFITGSLLAGELYLKKGEKYEKNLLWEKALPCYETSIKCNPYNPYYYSMAGYISSKMILIEKNKKDFWLKKSIDYYRKSLALNKMESSTYYYLGNLYIEQGQDREVPELFEHMIKLDPYNRRYLLTFGSFYQLKGNRAKAIEIYEKYLVLRPGDGRVKGVVEKLKVVSGE